MLRTRKYDLSICLFISESEGGHLQVENGRNIEVWSSVVSSSSYFDSLFLMDRSAKHCYRERENHLGWFFLKRHKFDINSKTRIPNEVWEWDPKKIGSLQMPWNQEL